MGNTLLHRARREAGFRSYADFAEAAGIDATLWARCEKGLAEVPDEALGRVAPALGVSELEAVVMSADGLVSGGRADEVRTEAPRQSELESAVNGPFVPTGREEPRLYLYPNEGRWVAIDASDMSQSFVESFSTREAAAAWLLKPGLEAAALRAWEDGRATRNSSTEPRRNASERHVALEIDATWAKSVAGELGITLSAEDAELMAEYAADNLWGSDLLAEVGHDQLVAEIENFDEWRKSEGDDSRTSDKTFLRHPSLVDRDELERQGVHGEELDAVGDMASLLVGSDRSRGSVAPDVLII